MTSDNLRATTLTVAGIQLLTKCLTGKELHFTRVVAGDGELESLDPALLKERTEMVHEVMELPIKTTKVMKGGTMVMNCMLDNTNLADGFFAREIGIFATDPDTQEEVLYSYRNTGDYSDFVPAGKAEPWNIIWEVITVVAQASNITVVIDGSVIYATLEDLNAHEIAPNPHPNFLNIGQEVETATWINCGVSRAGGSLDRMTLDNARKLILGDASSIPDLTSRVRQLERENANIMLKMEAENMMPDCNMLLAENFDGAIDDTNRTKIKVISAVSGDDSVDVESVYNLRIGDWIWVSDGLHSEYRQIKSTIKNGGAYRVILTSVLNEAYILDGTYIYFTTCNIDNGVCMGSTDILSKEYTGETWSGSRKGGTATSNVKLDTSLDNADSFSIDGDGVFNESGLISVA